MTAARSLRARWACGLAVGAGFGTIPLNGLLVLIGFSGVNFGGIGNAALEETGAWIGNAVALGCALTGAGLGWWHRREIEVHHVPPVDAGLARAGEILGVLVAALAAFLLLGTAQLRGWI